LFISLREKIFTNITSKIMARKKTPENTETELLMLSARKCCLCFGLSHDLNEKAGQV